MDDVNRFLNDVITTNFDFSNIICQLDIQTQFGKSFNTTQKRCLNSIRHFSRGLIMALNQLAHVA